MGKKWIQGMHMQKGALHQDLGVPQGQPIPVAKIQAATNSNNPKEARRANLALELRGFNKKG